MLLVSHFDYWAFEPSSNWAMLQWCRSDPLPFGRRKNPPTKIVTEISVCKLGGWKLSYETVSTTYTALYRISDNTSHSIRSALFTRVNPNRVTLCDAIRRADAYQISSIRRIIVFFTFVRNWHIIELYSNFWNHPTSSHFWLFYANFSTGSLWSNQWWVSSSPTPSSSIFRKYFNISQVQYQSIHESQIINIS